MKIGTLTYWTTSNNYGQLLQCYALQQSLKLMGHDPYLIRYDPFSGRPSMIRRLQGITLSKIASIVSGEQAKEKKHQAYIEQMDALRDFDSFRADYLTFGQRDYSCLEELQQDPPNADVYICGSDQVWHNSFDDSNTPAWYLDFGTARRISYAASIGRRLKNVEMLEFKRLLSSFSAISLRESSATDLCHSLGFDEACTVLDPTLLLEDDQYPGMNRGGKQSPYLFAYLVNVIERDDKIWDSVKRFVDDCGMSVRPVYASGYRTCVEFLKSEYASEWPTIPQWLDMMRGSMGVVSTSFHGVALSIVMHKPFVAIPLNGKQSDANDRLFTLLEYLGLSNRMLLHGDSFEDKMACPINWNQVDEKLDLLRSASLAFLNHALDDGGLNA